MSSPVDYFKSRISTVRSTLDELDVITKAAFQPAPAMPQPGQQPPMDPSMMQGPPQGGPPMDPAMMQGGPPPGMDPAMMQGPPPGTDPAMQGGVPPEQLEEMMSLLEQMGQALSDTSQRLEGLEQHVQGQASQIDELTSTLQSAMQPAAPEGQDQQGGW